MKKVAENDTTAPATTIDIGAVLEHLEDAQQDLRELFCNAEMMPGDFVGERTQECKDRLDEMRSLFVEASKSLQFVRWALLDEKNESQDSAREERHDAAAE